MKANTQKGSTALWVIILAMIIIVGGGAYYYFNRSHPVQTPVITDQQSSSATGNHLNTIKTNITSSNVSNLTCDQVFPLDVVKIAFPSASNAELKGGYAQGVGLSCTYNFVIDLTNFQTVTASVGVPDLSVDTYDTQLNNLDGMYKSYAIPGASVNSSGCTSINNIGIRSDKCIGVIKNSIVETDMVQIVFITSNNKYTASAVLGVPPTVLNKEKIVEQMAKEVNAKLSSL